MHGDAKENMDDYFLFKEFLSLFKKSIPRGITNYNQHLLILDGHGSHVTLKIIKQARIWIGHGYITFSHFSCLVSIRCELFQTFEEREGQCNG
jgi:hypothetical protein